MKIKDAIKQLQSLPQDFILKIPAKTVYEALPDFETTNKLMVNQLSLPVTDITTNIKDKCVHLQFDNEIFLACELKDLKDKELNNTTTDKENSNVK